MTDRSGKLYLTLVTLMAVIVTALEILDGTIVSVALNTMRGSLGATIDQMSWTMTAYITAAAICIPLTGFLAKKFGRRNLMLVAVTGFGLASILCGMSTNINEIVILRFAQGAVGTLLAPLSQGVLMDAYGKENFSKAMSFYGIGLITAPILGPILGAVVTNGLGWRWDFFINMPVCALALIGVAFLVPKSKGQKKMPIDWMGAAWMALAIGAMEYVLNRGNRLEWFSSNQILILSVVAIFALVVFVMHSLHFKKRNIVDLTILKDAGFRTSMIIMMFFTMAYIATNAWIPTMLESLQNYPILTAGETMLTKGFASLASMILIRSMMKHIPGHYILMVGCLFFAAGTDMLSHFNLQVDQHFFLMANLLQGFSTGMIFIPLSSLAYRNIKVEDRDMASGLFVFSRTLGSSIGIAIFSNIVSRESQINWHELGSNMAASNPNFIRWLGANHYNLHSQLMPSALASHLDATSNMVAYTDAFHLAGIIVLCLIPLALFLRDKKQANAIQGQPS